MGADYTHSHAAALLTQLPRTSRMAAAIEPDCSWSDEMHMLASIDYSLRILVWQRSKDAQHNRNRPKPPMTPSQMARERDRAKGFDKALVDRVLGIGGE